MSAIRSVTDEKGRTIMLATTLGVGGQGEVYRSSNQPELVVKLLLDRAIESVGGRTLLERLTTPAERIPCGEEARRALGRKLSLLRSLPLPDDLPIARPLATLRGHVGYTMRLLRDMVPMRALIVRPEVDLAEGYLEIGGLRRRLVLLARLAASLGRLHGLAIAYGDLSLSNVFISEAVERSEVWLIDADNLAFTTDQAPGVVTPGFGAPELMRGGCVTTLSDSWSFAVLAFWVLTQVHPFLGARVTDGAGWDQTVSRTPEERAFAGELPWVLDEHDRSNAANIPLQDQAKVLSPGLLALFERALGAGRRDPTARPTMLAWVEALERAADHALSCPSCRSTYFGAGLCPWCEVSVTPDYLDVVVWRYEPELDSPSGGAGALRIARAGFDAAQKIVLPRRLVTPSVLVGRDEPALELEPLASGFRVRAVDGRPYWILLPGRGVLEPLEGPWVLPDPRSGSEWRIHTGELTTAHRALTFRHVPSAAGART